LWWEHHIRITEAKQLDVGIIDTLVSVEAAGFEDAGRRSGDRGVISSRKHAGCAREEKSSVLCPQAISCLRRFRRIQICKFRKCSRRIVKAVEKPRWSDDLG